jgi:ribonuclease PH
MRPSKRAPDELRRVSLEPGAAKHAEGSCLVKFGDTHVLGHRQPAGTAPAVPEGLRQGLGDGRIRHAAPFHP